MAKTFEFNKGQTGTLIDSVSKGVITSTLGPVGFQKKDKGKALFFNGSSTKLISSSLPCTYPISYRAIINWDGTGLVHILDQRYVNNGIQPIYIGSSGNLGKIQFISSSNPSIEYFNYILTPNIVYDICVTYDGSYARLYINGFYQDAISVTGSFDARPLYIGSRNSNANFFRGNIYLVQVYNTVLSQQEINTMYKEFLNSSPTEKEIRGFEYPKPTDLSYEDGLVAAYSFSPETVSNGTLIDVSGNGKNVNLVNGLTSTKDGLFSNGVNYIDAGVNFYKDKLNGASGVTIVQRFKINSLSQNQYGVWTTINGGLSAFRTGLFISTNNFTIGGRSNSADSFIAIESSETAKINTWYSYVAVLDYENKRLRLFIDGVLVGEQNNVGWGSSSLTYGTPSLGDLLFGHPTAGRNVEGEFKDLKIYNYAFTPQQAKNYHNSFVKPVIVEDFSNHAVSETSPKGWVEGTGSYIIDEIPTPDSVLKSITTGTKVLRCTTAGTTAIQSKQDYGEWEFDVYKGADGNDLTNQFISSSNNLTTASGYRLFLNSSERVLFRKYNSGNLSDLFYTATSYITNNTWYRLKVARLQSEGVFKDIPTLQTSNLANSEGGAKPYSTFTAYGRYGFSAACDASDICIAGTADEISITNTAKYLVEFDLKLNSGTVPSVALKANTGLTGNISNHVNAVNGRNSIVLTATTITTGALGFFNTSTATDYEVSGLTIRRIYPADTFAVFIKGGSFGDNWTLVSTTGGSGTNPVTDSTYTTSNYFVADLDAGDRLSNLKITNGVKL